jgi:hypothetical protein
VRGGCRVGRNHTGLTGLTTEQLAEAKGEDPRLGNAMVSTVTPGRVFPCPEDVSVTREPTLKEPHVRPPHPHPRGPVTAPVVVWKRVQFSGLPPQRRSGHLGAPSLSQLPSPRKRSFGALPQEAVIYFGIIDFLQEYNKRKLLEHMGKAMLYEKSSISVTNPPAYSNRFRSFMSKLFKAQKEERRENLQLQSKYSSLALRDIM